MATVHVSHTLGDLEAALASRPARITTGLVQAVEKTGTRGNTLARRFAQELSGPHGTSYFKRLSGESTGALSYEYGPHAGGVPVGGGWRHGTPNTELDRSADIVGPAFARLVRDVLEDTSL